MPNFVPHFEKVYPKTKKKKVSIQKIQILISTLNTKNKGFF